MKILVLSDIHAYTSRPNGLRPSYVKVGDPASADVQFEELFKQDKVPKPTLIACPGDMCDQADQASLDASWKFLNRLSEYTTDKLLLATAGNHDLDSRFENSAYDAKGLLQNLAPLFPSKTNKACSKHKDDLERHLWFWARNFYLYSEELCRFVVLNSAAFHGYGKDDAKEYKHGRISDVTIKCIKNALEEDDQAREERKATPAKLNVLICHHHVEQDGVLAEDSDYSAMIGAHALLHFLSDSNYGRWLVIHGHRHRARLFEAGGASGPIVLSAASFGATRDKDYFNSSPNQAHLVELDFKAMEELGYLPAGQIRSWTWAPSVGWLSGRTQGGGLPPVTGFGFRGSVDQVARAIAALLPDGPMNWSTITEQHPEWRYLTYTQIEETKKVLKRVHKVEVEMTEEGIPRSLEKQK